MFGVWFLYALAAAVFFGFTTIVDKLMLEKRLSSFSYFVSFLPPALVFCVCVLLFFPKVELSFPYGIAFVAGLASAGGYFIYVLSIRGEEASRIAALTSLYPAMVAVLALFFVNEILPADSYVGIIFMILGSALISYKRKHVKKIIPISLVLILIATNFCYSLDQTLSKLSLDRISFWPFLMMFMCGRFAVVIPGVAVSSVRTKLLLEVKRLGRRFALILGCGSILWTLGIVFFFYAASLGPIALVSTMGLVAPLLTLSFAILITKYLPGVLGEEIDRETVGLKLFATILIFVGTYLVIV